MNDVKPTTSDDSAEVARHRADQLKRLREFGSDTALARLALSEYATGAAEDAARLVATTGDDDIAWLFDRAQMLQAAADSVLHRLVLWAKQSGRSWEEIGRLLDMSKQAAHERWGKTFEQWQDQLCDPVMPMGGDASLSRLPAGLNNPQFTAERLDEWVRHHREPDAPEPDGNPVSDGLPARDIHDSFGEVAMRNKVISQRLASGREVPAEIEADLDARQEINRRMYREQVTDKGQS